MNRYRNTILQKNGTTGIGIRTFVPANIVIRQDQFQGCTATSSLIELNHGEEVTVVRPVPGNIMPGNQGWEDSRNCHCLLPDREYAVRYRYETICIYH